MAGRYTLTAMPARAHRLNATEQKLMRQFGKRLTRARETHHLSASALAAELGISRNTLRAAERGNASVTIGTYLRIMGTLGLADDLTMLAASPSSDVIARRMKALEAQVVAGTRDARSLVAIPRKLAKESRVTFPKHAFGKVRSW